MNEQTWAFGERKASLQKKLITNQEAWKIVVSFAKSQFKGDDN